MIPFYITKHIYFSQIVQPKPLMNVSSQSNSSHTQLLGYVALENKSLVVAQQEEENINEEEDKSRKVAMICGATLGWRSLSVGPYNSMEYLEHEEASSKTPVLGQGFTRLLLCPVWVNIESVGIILAFRL